MFDKIKDNISGKRNDELQDDIATLKTQQESQEKKIIEISI